MLERKKNKVKKPTHGWTEVQDDHRITWYCGSGELHRNRRTKYSFFSCIKLLFKKKAANVNQS